ncbi:glycosyltransferase [Mycobacterium sp.]|uniref:glycosyltransferase n=1 Tax=Mycobacterium sp. TaxID=1785 RepID=UPI003BB0A893
MLAPAPRVHERAIVVIPAHNEHAELSGSLRAVVTAALCAPIPVAIVVVLDATDDDSAELAGQFGPDVHFISVEAHNVGAARAAGFAYARSLVTDTTKCWYATTDADSRVGPDWLLHQLGLGADMVLGVVRVDDWCHRSPDVAERYLRTYGIGRKHRGGHHDHIHGANMGFSAEAYWRVGGFRALPSGEDVDLVARFEAAGYSVHRDAELSVITSSRTLAKAPGGFADRLDQLEKSGDCA